MRTKVPGIVIPDEIVERLKKTPKKQQKQEGKKICLEIIEQVKDIEGVFVANYLTLKTFSWIKGEETEISLPQFKGGVFKKTKMHERIYEVPDEISYTLRGDKFARKRQKTIIEAFRKIFPDSQRRAIDCTGLRMLEISDGNLLAYGDCRGATKIWDTIPSIKFLFEHGRRV